MPKVTLLWFTHNLRLDDNAVFEHCLDAEQLICCFVRDPGWFKPNRYTLNAMGAARRQFLDASLHDLDQRLQTLGQQLLVVDDNPIEGLSRLIQHYKVDRIVASTQVGVYEQRHWREIGSRFPHLERIQVETHSLLRLADLPFSIDALPDSFSKFRKQVEPLAAPSLTAPPESLPPPVFESATQDSMTAPQSGGLFEPGETGALNHLNHYCSGALPQTYKLTRNALDGWDDSTKFSPWLAFGALSARRILAEINRYEQQLGANESTYWIKFELLWRDYFQFYALQHGKALFNFRGPFKRNPLTSFYPERFKAWCTGTTPYPIVNACMHQLNATGYMSNRGRQLVASCLVHELQLDWRYGAAYFEQQLIDYDVASNWGNWQYLAGVGADPRGHRKFDLDKQTQSYDPEHQFIRHWQGEQSARPLPTQNYYDWPV